MGRTVRYAKPLLIVFLNVSFVLWIVKENYIELAGQTGLTQLLSYIVALSLLQSAIIVALERRNAKAAVICLTVFLIFNFFFIAVIHVPPSDLIGGSYLPVLIIPSALIALVSWLNAWRQFLLMALVFLVLTTIQTIHVMTGFSGSLSHLPAHLSVPEFEKKPNIYLVSYDALIPQEAAREFLRMDKPEYIETLEGHDLREVRSAFAAFVPTRPSLNSIVAMDKDFYESHPKKMSLATGISASPLYQILNKNGYKVQFFHQNKYFGPVKGPHLDAYLTPKSTGRGTICRHIEQKAAFIGFCWLEAFLDKRTQHETVLELIKKAGQSSQPRFTMGYISAPGHTKQDYDTYRREDWEEYKDAFAEKAKTTAKYIDSVIETIKTSDPKSVLIIFGDHGAWISRTWNRGPSTGSEWSQQRATTERHLVALYVYPKTFCADEIGHLYDLIRLGRSISKCLSGGRDPFPSLFQSNDDHWLPFAL